jgi:hypothetical protein
MPDMLIARPMLRWRRVPLTVLLLAAQVAVGVLALVLRTVRVVVTLAATAATDVEQQLAARTGHTPLSQTSIAALAAAFVHEFHAAYRAPAR